MRALTTTVELEGSLEGNALFGSGCLGESSLSCVQRVDICLMMLLVVKLHDLATDERLESIIGVRKIWESVRGRHFELLY